MSHTYSIKCSVFVLSWIRARLQDFSHLRQPVDQMFSIPVLGVGKKNDLIWSKTFAKTWVKKNPSTVNSNWIWLIGRCLKTNFLWSKTHIIIGLLTQTQANTIMSISGYKRITRHQVRSKSIIILNNELYALTVILHLITPVVWVASAHPWISNWDGTQEFHHLFFTGYMNAFSVEQWRLPLNLIWASWGCERKPENKEKYTLLQTMCSGPG